MRLTPALLLPALCWSASATASVGHVYLYDYPETEAPLDGTKSLSPVAARMVMAQRLSMEDYHSADLYKDEVIEAINTYGVHERLFGVDEKWKRAFILIRSDEQEMEEDIRTSIPHQPAAAFALSPPPTLKATDQLFLDLAQQASPARALDSYTDVAFRTRSRTSKGVAFGHYVFANFSSVADFREAAGDLFKLMGENVHASIVVVASQDSGKDASKGWGNYAMPTQHQHPLHKRQNTEEPLSTDDAATSVKSSTSRPTSQADSSPLPGILPQCFSTLSACNTLTRNCTGHGSCSLRNTDGSAKDGSPHKNCYACTCEPSVAEIDGKESTTYWGGAACQKRDVSVQFWLIALFSVAMVGLVSFAVGQVWSMGDAELPSVLGAGVTGPSARR